MTSHGPLPEVDAGAILQEQSKRALQAALPPSEYIFRDERLDDYGVDGAIELLADRKATNIRAQVQLKGRSNTHVSKSGAVAVQISTANLNYLLNGNCPLYVLFRPESNELRFAFAREEWLRIERDNANWRNQQWITVHFCHVLTPESLIEINRSIAAEAVLRRAVDERLNKLRAGTGHAVIVDAQSLSVTDSSQILKALSQIGQSLTDSGLATLVIERARLVPTNMLLGAPQAALAVAHAHFHLSRYFDASAAIRQLLLTNPSLDVDGQSLLDFLYISVRRMLGEIEDAKYSLEMEAWLLRAPEDLAAQYEMSRAWSSYVKTITPAVTDFDRGAARKMVRGVLERARRVVGQRVLDYIELLELTLRQHEIEDAVLGANALSNIAALGIGDAHFARELASAASDTTKAWLKAVENLASATCSPGSHTYCGVLLLRGHAVLAQERQRQYAALTRGERDIPNAGAFVSMARETLRVARELEDRESEFTAMLALAETLDTCGNQDEATVVAREALKIAELSGCALQVRQASHFLDGTDRTESRLREVAQIGATSEEEIIRNAGDNQLQFMAATLATAYRLPSTRIPNIFQSLASQRQLAKERQDWCRHIALAEYRANHESAITMYSKPPLLKVVCMKLGKEFSVQLQDARLVSEEFRQLHCRACAHQSHDVRAGDTAHKSIIHQERAQSNKAKAVRRKRRRVGK